MDMTKLLKPETVTVFSKTYCPFCTKAKEKIAALKIGKTLIIEVDNEPTIGEDQVKQLHKMSNSMTYPKIFVGKEVDTKH